MNELLLMCMIAGRRAAIPAIRVQSVIEIDEITPIPGAPSFIRGLTALRSQALTVIDCTVALGLEPGETPAQQRAAVVDIEGHLYALLVDAAYDVGEARSEPIEVPGGFGPGWQAAARGMVETDGGPTLLIEVEKLVTAPVARVAA
ncbi:MAG: chemotaxis protein CheW [Pseudomonadota bacterium]|nr:chemotaxis protein CheW [Pseudomonadota bacterium]